VSTTAPWWKSAVFYQVYPRSFADGNGDGIGDLAGLRARLDHLVWLGVDALWLSPIYPSPMADFGYDVADYCDVDPLFGTLADLDRLASEVHARGLRLILDWVPNHTSAAHPWFVASRRSRTDPKRAWYVWRDPGPDGAPPNNWVAAFGSGVPAWTRDTATGQYYLHSFLPAQPDLDWSNPEVVAAMHGVLRFWLERGIDGFRVDVVQCLGKDPRLPDDPPDRAGLPHAVLNEHETTHAIVRDLRRLVDSYPGERVLVGEVFLLFAPDVTRYYGQGDELHLAFDLPRTLHTPWTAEAWRERVVSALPAPGGAEAWPTLVLSNHDTPRHRTRLGSEARARAAAVLLLTLPGTPFLYAGEELGLEDAIVPPERRVDPGGRDGCRAPIPWAASPSHGWPADPWLPFPPEPERRNVATLAADPGSILHLYRRLLAVRRGSPALSAGRCTLREAPTGVLAYERALGDDRRTVLVNFASTAASCPADAVVEASSDGRCTAWHGILEAEQAVVLRPR
jgi:alpha-glucosidase